MTPLPAVDCHLPAPPRRGHGSSKRSIRGGRDRGRKASRGHPTAKLKPERLGDARANGTLLLFTVNRVKTPGKPNVSNIREIETFLIGTAEGRNPELINKRTPPDVLWSIKGVYNCGPGKPDKAAIAFKEMMGLQTAPKAMNGVEAASEPVETRPTVSTNDDEPASIQAQ